VKWVFAVIAAVVILTAAAIVALPRLVDVPRVQALVATNASHALGRPVRFASLSVSVFPLPGVTLHQLEVAEDPQFGAKPFLTLDSGRLRLRLRPLLSGRVEFAELVLAKPVITVMRDTRGRLNVASLGATGESRTASRPGRGGSGAGTGGGAPLALPESVRISDGVLVYVAQATGAAPASYRVEHLDLALDATGPQIVFKGSARVTPGDLALKFSDGVVTITPGPTLAGAPVRANVTLESADVSPLVASAAGPALGVGGALKGALVVAGTVGAPTASGEIKLSKLTVARTNPQCPEPKRRTLAVPSLTLKAAWRDSSFSAEPLQAELAKGTVNARLTASLEHGTRVQLDDLAVKALPLESLLVDFLCQGYAVTGPLDLVGGLAFATARPLETLSGPGSFKIGAGKIVELRATYDQATRGGDSPDGRRPKATLHWVSAEHAIDCEVRLYDRLFRSENPEESGDFLADLNPDSLKVVTHAKLEPSVRGAAPLSRYQFERVGYFCVDPETTPGKPAFNRTVALKDAWAKVEKKHAGK